MADLHIPDRANVNWSNDTVGAGNAAHAWLTYGTSGGRAGIHKVSEGTGFADHTFPRSRQAMKDSGIIARGWYHFLRPGDPITQARLFARLVGALEPGEWTICDAEVDGATGALASRFCDEVDRILSGRCWIYSYDSFARANGLWSLDRPQWLAAYQRTEPTVTPHVLWQHTNGVDGVPCNLPGIGTGDCSVFHGSVDDLLALIGGDDMPLTEDDKNWLSTTIDARITAALAGQGVSGAGDALRMGRGYFMKNADGTDGAWVPGIVGQVQDLLTGLTQQGKIASRVDVATAGAPPVDVNALAREIVANLPAQDPNVGGKALSEDEIAAKVVQALGAALTKQ